MRTDIALIQSFLSEGISVRFLGRGRSMAPSIPDGTLVSVDPASDDLRVGQVVLFSSGGRLVAHRIRAIDSRAKLLICQGDSWRSKPETVSVEAVIGVVSAPGAWGPRLSVERLIGYLARALRGIIRPGGATLAESQGGKGFQK